MSERVYSKFGEWVNKRFKRPITTWVIDGVTYGDLQAAYYAGRRDMAREIKQRGKK